MTVNIVFFLLSIIALVTIYILLKKRIDKSTNNEKIIDEISKDLDKILSEINQATERNILVLEDKISQLKEVIAIADKRIRLLNDEKIKSHKKDNLEEGLNTKIENNKPQVNINLPEDDNKKESELTYEHLNRFSVMSGMISPSISTKQIKTFDLSAEKEKVINLYKSGIDSTIIARNVGISLGEVQLIISLYQQTKEIE